MPISDLDSLRNPLLHKSSLPYGLPDFDAIEAGHFLPAFESGFEQHLAEVAAIRDNPEPADFQNTAGAMELAGNLIQDVSAVFFNVANADADAEIRQIERLITPRLSQHSDAIHLDSALYQRFAAIDTSELSGEGRRLVEEYLDDFRRQGAALDEAAKTRLRELNTELAGLSTQFSQASAANMNSAAVLVTEREELAGLSEAEISAAAEAAALAGHTEGYLLTVILPSGQPALAALEHRELRERLHTASIGRGSDGLGADTLQIAKKTAMLRAERAALLGFVNHAEYETANQTAPSLPAITAMLAKLAPAAVRNALTEAEALAEQAGHPIEAWDWAYYSAKVRAARYDIDLATLKPYFELDRVLTDGVFFAANRLYGLTFELRTDLKGYHPDVRIWEVHNRDGSGLGLFLGDYFTRDSKTGGAWMNELVAQSDLLGRQAVVVNNLNISKPPAGEAALLSFAEVVTCFHEFGHALHGLFSEVTYPKFSGTKVPRDFVEYPSQVNEMWILWPEIIANYARHYQSGKSLCPETVDKLRAASLWGEGFATTEYLGAALLDQAWHQLEAGSDPGDPLEFEAAALKAAGVNLPQLPPRYRTGYFNHIFSNGYSAGYYAYIWSEVLDADTVEWFKENGGLTAANGAHFRRELLATGNRIAPLQAFRNFRGRDAEIQPLLDRRGLN